MMISRFLTGGLVAAVIWLPAMTLKAAAQTSLAKPGYENAVAIGKLRGPFGFGLDWSQYLDRQTESLSIVSGGRSYSWKDIFSRMTFFRIRSARGYDGGFQRPEYLNYSDTTVRFFKDDSGAIYAAGWRHFKSRQRSVFSIAPVNLSLLEKYSEQKKWDRAIFDTLAKDPGLSIVFQPYTEEGNAPNAGYKTYSAYKRRGLLPYLESKTKPLSDWFLEPFDAADYVVNADFATFLKNGDCDARRLGSDFFSAKYMLSPLGRCALEKVLPSSYWELTDSLDVWTYARQEFSRNKRMAASVSGAIPDISDIPDIFRFGTPTNYSPRRMYFWSSLARSACDLRTPKKGDWIILKYDDLGRDAFSDYSDEDAEKFAYRLYSDTDLGRHGEYPCEILPNSLTIQVYHGDQMIAEQTVAGSQVPETLSEDFLNGGIGEKIFRYSRGR